MHLIPRLLQPLENISISLPKLPILTSSLDTLKRFTKHLSSPSLNTIRSGQSIRAQTLSDQGPSPRSFEVRCKPQPILALAVCDVRTMSSRSSSSVVTRYWKPQSVKAITITTNRPGTRLERRPQPPNFVRISLILGCTCERSCLQTYSLHNTGFFSIPVHVEVA